MRSVCSLQPPEGQGKEGLVYLPAQIFAGQESAVILQPHCNTMWKHWVARAVSPYEPFRNFETAAWFWERLGKVFPEAIAAVLMPNHMHLLLPANIVASRKIAGLLASTSVRRGVKDLWLPIPQPTIIPDLGHLRRQIRYVALNPCRKKLCRDPLEWYWSTYREVIGAVAKPNQNAEKLAKILKDPSKNFSVRIHAYVSGDPSVSVSGTPFPMPEKPTLFPERSIGEILGAAASAMAMKPNQVRESIVLRNLFVHLAYRHGWQQPTYLGAICGIKRGAVHRMLAKGLPSGIHAAELCLGDKRLRGDDTLGFLTSSSRIVDTKR